MPDSDDRRGLIVQLRRKRGDPAGYGVIKRQHPLIDQRQSSHADYGLGHGSQPEACVEAHGRSPFCIGHANSALIHCLPIAGSHNHSAHNRALRHGRIQHDIQPLR